MNDDAYPRITRSEKQLRDLSAGREATPISPEGSRGIVLSPAWFSIRERKYIRRKEDFAVLRHSLLYFDKINWPIVVRFEDVERDFSHFPDADAQMPGDLRFLQEKGILHNQGHMFIRTPELTPDVAAANHRLLYLNLEFEEPGSWAVAQRANEFSPINPADPPTRAVLCSLVDALPMPVDDVSFEDILSFKEKHANLLSDMRGELDVYYKQIISSPDQALAQGGTVRKIGSAIGHLQRAADARPKMWRRAVFTVIIKTAAGGLAGGAAQALGLSIVEGAAVGGALRVAEGLLELRAQDVTTPTPNPGIEAYLYAAARHGVIRRPPQTGPVNRCYPGPTPPRPDLRAEAGEPRTAAPPGKRRRTNRAAGPVSFHIGRARWCGPFS